ncbi:MAG: PilZ domain-containing protein [Acidobacteria bacterium]|nr:PilZ domain-containing protein [Acidobacteriota bacterium]
MEKREETRDRKAMRVALDSGHGPIYGNTENVSPHGMRVVLHNKRVINPGQHVGVTVTRQGKQYELSGQVRWFRFEILNNILGLQFDEINQSFCSDILGMAPLGSQEQPFTKKFEGKETLKNEYDTNMKFGGLFIPFEGELPPLNQNVWVSIKMGQSNEQFMGRVVIHQLGGFGIMFASPDDVAGRISKLIN